MHAAKAGKHELAGLHQELTGGVHALLGRVGGKRGGGANGRRVYRPPEPPAPKIVPFSAPTAGQLPEQPPLVDSTATGAAGRGVGGGVGDGAIRPAQEVELRPAAAGEVAVAAEADGRRGLAHVNTAAVAHVTHAVPHPPPTRPAATRPASAGRPAARPKSAGPVRPDARPDARLDPRLGFEMDARPSDLRDARFRALADEGRIGASPPASPLAARTPASPLAGGPPLTGLGDSLVRPPRRRPTSARPAATSGAVLSAGLTAGGGLVEVSAPACTPLPGPVPTPVPAPTTALVRMHVSTPAAAPSSAQVTDFRELFEERGTTQRRTAGSGRPAATARRPASARGTLGGARLPDV